MSGFFVIKYLNKMSKQLDEKFAKLGENEQRILKLRHTCEHVLHTAMQKLYPGLKKAMGPATDDGFYFDFDLDQKVTEADFGKIEKEMNRIIKSGSVMKGREIEEKEARELFALNPYKIEWIDEIISRDEPISVYQMVLPGGKIIDEDICSGPHLESVSEIGAFKLLSIAGAYWRGDEKNKMLTRIYGTAFGSVEELDKYLWQLEEARKRDHKKLGSALELFMFHETSPGMPYWLPKGVILYNELIKFWREEHQPRGYQEIVSPILNKKELYVTSGHYEHYWEEMFVSKTADEGEYGVKAMNCPNAHIVFGSKTRSYKDLPLRLSDTDTLHRYERSGTLNGLLRVREFRQDDAHIYVNEEQIESEYQNVFEIVKRFYSVFGLNYTFRLGTRNPEHFIGDIETWNKAEDTLKRILKNSGVEYFILEGDGAFYGPKVDILIKDALGRDWQMGTIQLDFQQPRRFNLQYVAQDGSLKTPIAIHRVIYGSLERFIGIIIEHFAGVFPLWLAPVQVTVLPVSEKVIEYATKIETELKARGIRVELVTDAESLGKKIRNAEAMKIPYMLIVGEKEAESGQVSVRAHGQKDLGAMELSVLIEKVKKEIETKALP
jgi:threonyl-tRNA synthetase